jgi:hypothetical protein
MIQKVLIPIDKLRQCREGCHDAVKNLQESSVGLLNRP